MSGVVPGECAGHGGRCLNPVRYAATLTYCECGRTWAVQHGTDAWCGPCAPDVVDLCVDCAAEVRTWPAMTSMRSLPRVPASSP